MGQQGNQMFLSAKLVQCRQCPKLKKDEAEEKDLDRRNTHSLLIKEDKNSNVGLTYK